MQEWAPVSFTDLVFVFHHQSGVFHSFLKQFQNFVMKDLPTSFHLFIFYLMLFHSLLFFIICAFSLFGLGFYTPILILHGILLCFYYFFSFVSF